MNIVASSGRYMVYGDGVKTYDSFPVGSYDIQFNKMMGFYCTERPDLTVNESKIYGNHQEKVNKVLRSFEIADRNFGIILSGQKGIGKSLFARILATSAIEKGLPVFTVTDYVPGIADYISSIEQEVVVIFDEFEKTFGTHDDFDPQETMLSLFDGLDNGKKLFVITCNEVRKLNSFLLNRPGRFHYHFTLTNPSGEEIREYMTDKLLPEYRDNIDRVVNFSRGVDLTYDYLRAIVFELNQGYTLEESLKDLNIARASVSFDVTMTLENGQTFMNFNYEMDVFSKRNINEMRLRGYSGVNTETLWITFPASAIHYENNHLVVNPSEIRFQDCHWEVYDSDEQKEKELREVAKAKFLAEHKIKSCVFEKVNAYGVQRYDV